MKKINGACTILHFQRIFAYGRVFLVIFFTNSAQAYLEPSRTSTTKLFCKHRQRFLKDL